MTACFHHPGKNTDGKGKMKRAKERVLPGHQQFHPCKGKQIDAEGTTVCIEDYQLREFFQPLQRTIHYTEQLPRK